MAETRESVRERHARLLAPADMARRIAELGKEPRACLVCGAAAPRRAFERSGKTFWRCRGCALVFVHDIWPEFAEDVEHLEGTYRYHELQQPKRRQLQDYAELLAEFARYRDRGTLLEVGCGQGMFLAHVRDAGWRVRGVDVLPEVVRLAREERGLDVHLGELASGDFADGEFDVVYASEVIEHVVDPLALAREVRRVLRPGGALILDTGNACSWSARLRGAAWSYYLFGGHLHIRFFGPASARALAAASGYERCRTATHGFAFAESEELRGKWFKPLAKLAQAVLSPLAGPCGGGHRLRMTLERT